MSERKMTHLSQAPTDEGDIERQIAAWVSGLTYEDLPQTVRDTLKLFIIDTIGVIAGAAEAPGMDALRETVLRLEGRGTSTLLVGGGSSSPATAALLNGAAAHALDFDDQHDPARVHAFCVILPAVLAVAEHLKNVDGRRFLTALTAGVEVFCRLGLSCLNSLGRGWHPTTALGSIASAAAIANLQGLTAEETNAALGFGFVQLSGTTQSIADGSLSKRIGPGIAARNGVTAGYLAAAGLTAPWRYLTGAAGLYELHERGEVDRSVLVALLGTYWHLTDLSIKPFPCCRCNHTVIDLALAARKEGIRTSDIRSGTILLGKTNVKIVGAPFDPKSAANTVVHAQFNACYSFVRALEDGKVDFSTYEQKSILAESSLVAQRFSVIEAEDIEATDIAPARCELVMLDGAIRRYAAEHMIGSPQLKMKYKDVLAKFESCLKHGLGIEARETQSLVALIERCDTLEDCSEIVRNFDRLRQSSRSVIAVVGP